VDKLEVYKLSDNFQVVEVNLLLVFNPNHLGQVDMIEFNVSERFLLEASNLFSDNDLLEVNKGVLSFDIFLFRALVVSVFVDSLLHDLIFEIVEVGKSLQLVILKWLTLESW